MTLDYSGGSKWQRFRRTKANKADNLSLSNALSPSGGQEVAKHPGLLVQDSFQAIQIKSEEQLDI